MDKQRLAVLGHSYLENHEWGILDADATIRFVLAEVFSNNYSSFHIPCVVNIIGVGAVLVQTVIGISVDGKPKSQ